MIPFSPFGDFTLSFGDRTDVTGVHCAKTLKHSMKCSSTGKKFEKTLDAAVKIRFRCVI